MLIGACDPAMTNPEEAKDKFYEELGSLIWAVPRSNKLLVLGDFNAWVGRDHVVWDGVPGHHRLGKCISNGLFFLKMCAIHDLLITNTIFYLPNCIITRRQDRCDVKVNKTMCGAECWMNHHMNISKLKMQIQPKQWPQGRKTYVSQHWQVEFKHHCKQAGWRPPVITCRCPPQRRCWRLLGHLER